MSYHIFVVLLIEFNVSGPITDKSALWSPQNSSKSQASHTISICTAFKDL